MAQKTFKEIEEEYFSKNPSIADKIRNSLCKKGIHGKKKTTREYGYIKKVCLNCKKTWYIR